MSKSNTGGPAFPVPPSGQEWCAEGMTLRDYFAAAAMSANLIRRGEHFHDTEAMRSYLMADAMLKARGDE